MQTKKGQSIEDASMQMIEEEIGNHNYNELEWPIVRRIIHSTADFDFAGKNKVIFSKNAKKAEVSFWYSLSENFPAYAALKEIQ